MYSVSQKNVELNLNLPPPLMKSFLQLSVQAMPDPLDEHFQYASVVSNPD